VHSPCLPACVQDNMRLFIWHQKSTAHSPCVMVLCVRKNYMCKLFPSDTAVNSELIWFRYAFQFDFFYFSLLPTAS